MSTVSQKVGNSRYFDSLGNAERSKGGYDYVVIFKGQFGPFFKLWDQLNSTMNWNVDKTSLSGQGKKGDALYIYISDSDRTTNLLQNVMGISRIGTDSAQGKDSLQLLTLDTKIPHVIYLQESPSETFGHEVPANSIHILNSMRENLVNLDIGEIEGTGFEASIKKSNQLLQILRKKVGEDKEQQFVTKFLGEKSS